MNWKCEKSDWTAPSSAFPLTRKLHGVPATPWSDESPFTQLLCEIAVEEGLGSRMLTATFFLVAFFFVITIIIVKAVCVTTMAATAAVPL